jgi:hypothetical protein
MSQDIIGFYRGRAVNQLGMSIKDVLAMSTDQLETDHHYIQWVFPLPEKSQMVPTSPVLTQSDIDEFRSDDSLRGTMVRVILKMLDFYGLQLTTLGIGKGSNFDVRAEDWITPKNHNFLRLTRIIRSMKLLGLEDWAKSLYDCLCEVYEEHKGTIGPLTKKFWDEAIEK